MISLTKVISSSVESVGHDPLTQTLGIKFKNGGYYEYAGVSPEIYAGLLAAKSPGKFMRANIVGKFPCKKVDNQLSKL